MRIITSPTVQLGLDIQYPSLRHVYGALQFVGIHQRKPPNIPATSTADLLAPFALRPSLTASTTGRHTRDYYGASAPSHGPQSATDLPTTETGCPEGGRPRMVPTFTM